MKKLKNMSIIWKLNLLIIAISAGVLLLATVCFYLQYRGEYKISLVAEVEALASVVGFSCAPALLFDDRAAAAQSLSALGARKEIAAAFIYDKQGGLFSSCNPSSIRPADSEIPRQETSSFFDDRYLHVQHPIVINDSTVGSIHIIYSMEQLGRRQALYSVIAAAIFLACFILIMFLSFYFQRIITRPILTLIATVRRISHERDYALRVEKTTGDEIGALIDGFNEMLQEVQSRDLYLEEKVARRTAELKTANDNLVLEMQERREIEREREKLITELQTALNEVKALSGMLPICCSCKKIRNDQGYWLQIETYLQEHSNAEFSHGICPECAQKLYPELYKKEN